MALGIAPDNTWSSPRGAPPLGSDQAPRLTSHYRGNAFATYYAAKHRATPLRRLSNWRERQAMARALGCFAPFDSVLDLPTGTGRFLPLLASFDTSLLLAADHSYHMLRQGQAGPAIRGSAPRRIVASAFQIPLSDHCVDVAFCSRLLHHFADRDSRVSLLRELARVGRKGVVLSFFDADSFKHRRRLRKRRRTGKMGTRQAVTRSEMIAEAAEAGLEPVRMFALLRFHVEVTAAAFRPTS